MIEFLIPHKYRANIDTERLLLAYEKSARKQIGRAHV